MATYPINRIYRPEWWEPTASAPTVEPISLEEAKAHLRVDTSDEDAVIAGNIIAAREWMETTLNRALIARSHMLEIDRFPWVDDQLIQLTGGNLQSITSIGYVDVDGASQTWAASNYTAYTSAIPGRVGLAYGKSWPSIREWGLPVTITYVAGYGTKPSDVPAHVISGMLLVIGDLFESRQQSVEAKSYQVMSAQALTAGERVHAIY